MQPVGAATALSVSSHGTLRFSTSIRPNPADLPLCLDAHHENRYTLSGTFLRPVLEEAETAEELVSAAVRRLPHPFLAL